jgi:gluconate 2-dehydrogenase gamma chain
MSASRRTFLSISALAAVPLHAAGLQFFTAEEAKLLQAICEQIIPADRDAGATQAGVLNYIDLQLRGPLKRFAKYYRHGLAALAAAVDFLSLDSPGQTDFLRKMEAAQVKNAEWKIQSAASFFNMVVDHSMQGFYGSPKHGGNRDEVSWKMLGISGHRHI